MRIHYLLPALSASLLFLFCAPEKPPRPGPPAFGKTAFEKRIESAFFSDSAAKELRLLRNEIYARRGRTFESKDLREYFARFDWYRPNPAYRDTMLSKEERAAAAAAQACETYLQKTTAPERRHYDSVKTFSRAPEMLDTAIVDYVDYTGDGKKEKCVTAIMRAGDRVLVRHVVINGRDTIYDKESRASFAPDRDLPLFGVYNNYTTAVRLSPFGASLKLISPDIKNLYEGKKELKRYLARFKGNILVTVTSESVGCGYFWYAPEKRFEKLYCE
jgi:hypothetical protein